MIKILKASAGSGKTYHLAQEYIRLLVGSEKPDAYRHVLAVTFTNKATDEMKRRILKELHVLARNPGDSPYLEELKALAAPAVLQKRARQQLSAILHDYSAFAVSTIDRFFQQTLRAFSREIGQFSSYQVQLDRKELVAESVDRLLDTLSEEDRPLLEWLTRSVREDLRQNGRFSLEGRLTGVAESLQALPGPPSGTSRESLNRLREACQKVVEDFHKQVGGAARTCLNVLESCGVDPQDSNRGFLKYLYDYQNPVAPVVRPRDTFFEKALSPDQWFAKAKANLREKVEGVLEAPLQAFAACFEAPYEVYVTALLLQKQLYGLGVAGELYSAFQQIQKEKNVLCIEDSNTILRHIIDGTDTPFIYEKLGVRYEDFLLDEFQDTALIQWENFRPLLQGSESEGNDSLVVGDIKQSIYRWRGSDWNLLGSQVEQDFSRVQVASLTGNYRTCREIVDFNNEFFAYAAAELDRLGGEDPAAAGSISSLYADVAQQPRFRDPAPGSVEVCFTQDQMAEVLQTLADLQARGAQWQDIAILVRGNADGAAIAAALVEQHIPVVSDDSLYVKASVTVRRLVSQLSLSDAPDTQERPGAGSYLARSLDVHAPAQYHSLIDLSERLLQDLKAAASETFEAEVPYIQSFMDYLQDWVSTGGNRLPAFLKDWKDANPKIASPQGGNSVRVMTIHKSKGLEFPFVIVPFAEKVTLYKSSSYWCRPPLEGTPLEQEEDGLYYVDLDSTAAQSLFKEDYRRERKLAAIDNINVFYVALTRPKYGLKVIAAPPPKNQGQWKNLSQLLYAFVGGSQYFRGELYSFHSLGREKSGEKPLPATYVSFPADAGNRLRISPEAADYFGGDGLYGPQASKRIRGNVLHGILSRMEVAEDLAAAVDAAVLSGELPAAEKAATEAFLADRLAGVAERGWFAPGMKVLREAAIIGPDGGEYRPDRVLLRPDGSVTVVDFKFGEPRESYKAQVRRYTGLYRKMGYRKVEGYLWYLDDNFTIFADSSEPSLKR